MNIKYILVLLFIFGLINYSCQKELEEVPTFKFKVGNSYMSSSDTVAANKTVKVGFECRWNGEDELKSIFYTKNFELQEPYNIPSTQAENATYDLSIKKTANIDEHWTFYLVDSEGNRSTLDLSMYIPAILKPSK